VIGGNSPYWVRPLILQLSLQYAFGPQAHATCPFDDSSVEIGFRSKHSNDFLLTHISMDTNTIIASCISDPALAYFPCSRGLSHEMNNAALRISWHRRTSALSTGFVGELLYSGLTPTSFACSLYGNLIQVLDLGACSYDLQIPRPFVPIKGPSHTNTMQMIPFQAFCNWIVSSFEPSGQFICNVHPYVPEKPPCRKN